MSDEKLTLQVSNTTFATGKREDKQLIVNDLEQSKALKLEGIGDNFRQNLNFKKSIPKQFQKFDYSSDGLKSRYILSVPWTRC